MLSCSTPFFPFVECLPCGSTIISLQSIHDEHWALLIEIFLKHLVFSWLVSNFLCKIASFMLKFNHLPCQIVSLFYHHLRHLDVTLVSPSHECTLFHPSVHIRKHNIPVWLCLLEFVLVSAPSVEDLAYISCLMSSNKLLYALIILDFSHSV